MLLRAARSEHAGAQDFVGSAALAARSSLAQRLPVGRVMSLQDGRASP